MAAQSPWPVIHAEREALADDLAALTDEQWAMPSLCGDWTVRQVLAHLTATARMTPVKFFAAFAGSGFRFGAMRPVRRRGRRAALAGLARGMAADPVSRRPPAGTSPAPPGGTSPAPPAGTSPAPPGGTSPAPPAGTSPAPPAGYSGTPLPRKLGIKPGQTIALIGAPAGFADTLEPLPERVTVQAGLAGDVPLDVIVFFVVQRAELAARLDRLRARMAPACGLWIAWPKRASKVPTDMSDQVVREIALPTGLVDNKICAIDQVWSGLRLVIRRELR